MQLLPSMLFLIILISVMQMAQRLGCCACCKRGIGKKRRENWGSSSLFGGSCGKKETEVFDVKECPILTIVGFVQDQLHLLHLSQAFDL
jgi:hypothetical protein